MPTLWGENLSRRELLDRVGDVSQVGGLRQWRVHGGVGEGATVIELDTGKIRLQLLPSRGLDIGPAWYQGHSLAWISPAGFRHPSICEERGSIGWLRAFGGGLLTTCGLANVGEPCIDEGVEYGLHGRASLTPAFQISAWAEWVAEDYVMTVRGITREAALFGPKLEKRRTITAQLGQGHFRVIDEVQNIGSEPTPVMLLYHINLGWPLIGPSTRLEISSTKREAVKGTSEYWEKFPAPSKGFEESVVEHSLVPDARDWKRAQVISTSTSVEVAFGPTLSRFTQWRMFGRGDYVLGLEPGNVGVRGRAAERAAGTLPILQPDESRQFELQLRVEGHTQEHVGLKSLEG